MAHLNKTSTRATRALAAFAAGVFAFGIAIVAAAMSPGPALFMSHAMAAAGKTGVWDVPGRHSSSMRVTEITDISATAEWVVFEAPVACRIKRLAFVPKTTQAGADTDYFVLDWQNKGAAGTGTTSVIAAAVSFTSGVDLTAFDAKEFTVSTTDATLSLASGDVLSIVRTIEGDGLASPSGRAIVEFEPK